MKEKTKEFLKKNLIGFILGVVSAWTIIVYAKTYFPSNDVTYDNSSSGLSSTDVQGAIDELYGVCFPPKTGGDAILDKEPIVDTGDGLYEDEYEEGKHTYKGSNPNNYVYFNCTDINNQNSSTCEIWRIISINADKTIKIMRTESIGNMAWDSSSNNNWARPATLNTYLNGTYYNGLNIIAQEQILEAIYYAGGVIYDNNDMQNQISNEKVKTSKVKIALPTLSEYLRANSNKKQCGTISLNNDNYSTCENSNWMYDSNNYWWTLSPRSGYSDIVFYVYYGGRVNTSIAGFTDFAVRPTITLSSEVKIIGGTGTRSDPYQIE